MWTLLLLFRFFQVEQPGLITPAWVNANWIWLLCESDTRVLPNKVVTEAEIKFSACGEETCTPLSPVAWREEKKRAWPIDAAISVGADRKHPHRSGPSAKQVAREQTRVPWNSRSKLWPPFQGQQHVETTDSSVVSEPSYICSTQMLQKQLARMQDFGHTCCCQPMVVLGMIKSTAKRFFFPCIETENCHLHFSSQHKHLSKRPKLIFILIYIYQSANVEFIIQKKITYSKIKIDFQWGKQKCNHVNH